MVAILVSRSSDFLKYLDYKNTGEKSKNPDTKVCDRCFVLKPIENFDINQTDAKGRKTRRPSCIDCREIIDGIKLSGEERKKLEAKSPMGKISKCPICAGLNEPPKIPILIFFLCH